MEAFRSVAKCKPMEGELPMPEAEQNNEESEPELDQTLLGQVLQMGIPENPAKHALYKSGNNSADMAVTWYFSNMEDPSIQMPLMVKKAAPNKGGDDPP